MTVAPPPVTSCASARHGAGRGRGERELLALYRRTGDPAVRDRLVELFLPLARQLARRFERPAVPLDDLVQVASLGLLKAIDRYDPGYSIPFTAYAVPTITGELKRYLRDASWAMRVPRTLQERVVALTRAVQRLSVELGRSPTTNELAEEMGLSVEDVLEAREAGRAFATVSLEGPDHAEDGADALARIERLGADDDRYALVELVDALRPTLDVMSDDERRALRLRFEEDLTQSQIGERIGVSQMQVSRLLRSALGRLRTAAEAA